MTDPSAPSGSPAPAAAPAPAPDAPGRTHPGTPADGARAAGPDAAAGTGPETAPPAPSGTPAGAPPSAEPGATGGTTPEAAPQPVRGTLPSAGPASAPNAASRGATEATTKTTLPGTASGQPGRGASAAAGDIPAAKPPAGPRAPAPPARGHGVGPWLTAAGFVVLAAGLIWVWQRQAAPPPVAALRAEVVDLRATLARRDARNAAALAALARRVAGLEQQPAAGTPGGTPGGTPEHTAALAQAVDSLSQRSTVLAQHLSALAAQVATLSQHSDASAQQLATLAAQIGTASRHAEATAREVSALTQQLTAQGQHLAASDERMAALAAQRDTRTTATQDALAALHQDLATQQAASAALTGRVDALAKASGRTSRLAQVQAARAALAAGRPLGPLPGDPPALARFATAAPPTEAALRLAFPAAAQAALAASRPATAGKPFLDRVWARAQQLVTVRQGDRVILGDPAGGPLAAAQARLDAGDLAGAVAALGALNGPAAAAIAPWRDRAQAVLAARAALDAMDQARDSGG